MTAAFVLIAVLNVGTIVAYFQTSDMCEAARAPLSALAVSSGCYLMNIRGGER